MPRAFEWQEPFQYQKISQEEQERRGILGRLVGRIADPTKPTRNGRLYSRELWEKVLDDPIFNEKLENKQVWGELEHPQDGRTSIDYKNAAVCLAEKPKFGKDGFLYGVFDIVKTDCGKLLKTLLDYGSTFAISSRGDGDLFTNNRGQEEVDPDTYQCFTFDIVGVPGVKEARLTPVLESYDGKKKKSLNEALFDVYNEATSESKQIIKESLNTLGINLDESLFENKVDYAELTSTAKEMLKGRYGEITNCSNLRDALKKAVDSGNKADTKSIAQLLCKYDPDYVKEHEKVGELAKSELVDNSMSDGMDMDNGELDAQSQIELPEIPDISDTPAVANTTIPDNNNANQQESLNSILLKENKEKQLYNNTDDTQQPEEADDIIDEVENKEEDGNAMLEMVNTLQETLKTKQDMEATVLKLNEKLSVCYAKEAKQEDIITKLQEKLALSEKLSEDLKKAQSRTEKQSALIESANGTIRDLNAKCKEIVLKYNALVEKYNSNSSTMSSLNESFTESQNKVQKLIASNQSLREDLAKANETLTENQKTYATKLSESNTLVEKYKKVATRAINKYIDSQALKLDITSNEIKNRLPENYTFNDIDAICESLQKQKVSMNLLPFKTPNKLYESMNVEITGKMKKEPILENNNKVMVDDEVDDSLKSLAGM